MPHCHCIALHFTFQKNIPSINSTILEQREFESYYTIGNATNHPSFFSHNILDRKTDRDPRMMAKVFRSPGEYLPGPDSIPELRRDMQHFVIVGGGAAGLVSAYTLLRLGHKVGRYFKYQILNLFPHLDGWVL